MNKKGTTSRISRGKYLLCFLPFLILGCNLFKSNTPPVITSKPVTQVNEKEEYEYIVKAVDADGDRLFYSLETKPSWLGISGNKISGTAPEVNSDKKYSVSVKVSDQKDYDVQSYTLIVKNLPNNPPKITSEPIKVVNENSYYEYLIEAYDEDGDNLAYSLVTNPKWIGITGRKIYGCTPEVEKDSSVVIKAKVTDGKDSDFQEYNLNIINVPAPAVFQNVLLSDDVDIEYRARLKDLASANREVFHNGVRVDSLSKEISGKNYHEVLKGNKKGEWKFILSAEEEKSEESVEVPNYNPTVNLSELEPKLNFEHGDVLKIALPKPTDRNPEDNPVRYSQIEIDKKISYRIKGDSLYITNKKGAIGNYSLNLKFGSEEGGESVATLSGEISPTTIEWFNPFKRPAKGTYHYGSGDANQDGFIDSLDLQAISEGVQNDEADVNGDGIVDYKDGQLLEAYLKGDISYMPGQYEKLQTKEERDDWVKKMMKIDPTNKIPPNTNPDREYTWVSGNYATQTCINFFGYDDEVPWTKYRLENNRRFNLPMYFVGSSLYYSDGSPIGGHGMNAILTGDYALEFSDWNFVEPQNDVTDVQPGNWNMTIPGTIWIRAPNYFPNDAANLDMLKGEEVIIFKIESEGNIYYLDYPNVNPPTPNPKLVKNRP